VENYKRNSIIGLILVGIITVWALSTLKNIKYDYDYEGLYPKGDHETEFFIQHRDRFESDNDFVLVGIENDNGVFEKDFLDKIKDFTDTLSNADLIRGVISPTNFMEVFRDPFTGIIFEEPLLHLESEKFLAFDSLKIFESEELVGNLFSEDGNSVLVYIKTDEGISKVECDTLWDNLVSISNNYDFDKVHIAGRALAQSYYLRIFESEMTFFLLLAVILAVIFLFIAFRSFWGVWVPLIVVVLTVIWHMAFISVTGRSINIFFVVLPVILFVVSMSDVVHITSKYYEEIRLGRSKLLAIKKSVREIGLATLITSLTTAIGFLTLVTSDIVTIRSFGLYTAVGVFIAYVLAITVLPAVIILNKKPKIASFNRGGLFWDRNLRKLFLKVLKGRVWIMWSFILVALISIWGLSYLRINNYILDDLKKDDFLRQDFEFFEEKFTGFRPFEVSMAAVDSTKNMKSLEVLKEIDKVDDYLEKIYGVRSLVSPASIIKKANQIYNGGSEEY